MGTFIKNTLVSFIARVRSECVVGLLCVKTFARFCWLERWDAQIKASWSLRSSPLMNIQLLKAETCWLKTWLCLVCHCNCFFHRYQSGRWYLDAIYFQIIWDTRVGWFECAWSAMCYKSTIKKRTTYWIPHRQSAILNRIVWNASHDHTYRSETKDFSLSKFGRRTRSTSTSFCCLVAMWTSVSIAQVRPKGLTALRNSMSIIARFSTYWEFLVSLSSWAERVAGRIHGKMIIIEGRWNSIEM